MKINHVVIRGILKWTGFILFMISILIKLKDILKYGGTKKNEIPDAQSDGNSESETTDEDLTEIPDDERIESDPVWYDQYDEESTSSGSQYNEYN